MGHYDECRDGYCGKCGQTWGNCEHTEGKQEHVSVVVQQYSLPTDKISIGRFISSDRSQGVDFIIEDKTGTIIYSGEMTLENFAKAITGHAMMPIRRMNG